MTPNRNIITHLPQWVVMQRPLVLRVLELKIKLQWMSCAKVVSSKEVSLCTVTITSSTRLSQSGYKIASKLTTSNVYYLFINYYKDGYVLFYY